MLFVFRVGHAFLSGYCSLVVTCYERADISARLYMKFFNVLPLSHVMSRVRYGA